MEDNPYFSLVSAMNGSGAQGDSLRLMEGRVTAVSPLAVEAAGISISGDALRINAELIRREVKDANGTFPASAVCGGHGAVSSISISGGTLSYTPDLNIGDMLCLLTNNDQIFYALCKVVSG